MSKRDEKLEQVLQNLKKIIPTIRYGSITLTIHDDEIVQIEKSKKIRLIK
ncbi:YezD family protein [Ureibacillus sp. FSL K6-8385]|uniref:DUF2292 domain-containing protein n=1 Tax=Ureibacillus terrenus TaxID=118246 RepID=A0A540V0K9_9BACL|nr:YezD family protein [Ureibacillus terrenus]MED3662386.1 YezD family protein [Ureibacillus terrenus]MED3763742.1 YezD family protein [Ureibacillus terrenus]TQE90275.1 DUF2292 domain-containing protein [Ureibacillus terrenus]